jgi:uncharacterized membrane protein
VEDDRIARIEHAAERVVAPAWRRHTPGERRWPSAVAIAAMIALQMSLPERWSAGPRWALPLAEVVLIGVLMLANPGRVERGTPTLRRVGLTLIILASLGNAWSVARLVADIAGGGDVRGPASLLAGGGAVWLINVLTFAVWYWEFDRGGPLARARGTHPHPDLLFPQMATPDLAPPDWEPQFADYLFLAFTNSTAFSPTDTLPLSRWVKIVMLLQAGLSLVIAALVVARAVNALP